MICLSSNAVMILLEDGSKKQFDAEELQNRLTLSCNNAGLKDIWLAEDMTNAVESALLYQSERGTLFTENEISMFVEKMLEQAGYKEVAQKFRLAGTEKNEEKLFSLNAISKFLKNNANFNDKNAFAIAEKIILACTSLGIKNPSSGLILELAKTYNSITKERTKIESITQKNIQSSVLILQKKEILPALSEKTNELIASGMISVSGVSTLFPSVKIDINFEFIAKHYELAPVLTELSFFPCFPMVANAVDEIVDTVLLIIKERLHNISQKTIPIYLRFSDMYPFSKKYFGIESPEGNPFCNELALAFAEYLKYPVVIKITKC